MSELFLAIFPQLGLHQRALTPGITHFISPDSWGSEVRVPEQDKGQGHRTRYPQGVGFGVEASEVVTVLGEAERTFCLLDQGLWS